jgi:hypothetical protein
MKDGQTGFIPEEGGGQRSVYFFPELTDTKGYDGFYLPDHLGYL